MPVVKLPSCGRQVQADPTAHRSAFAVDPDTLAWALDSCIHARV